MAQHVSFVLLAEFDIDQGALLQRQFPTPLGTDEQLLAGLMLPDGAEKQSEDWTVFFLNQTPMNTIAPIFVETPEKDEFDNGDEQRLLYVLSLVRTKHDNTVRRGGIVKAMAICTYLPFIHVFKPVLLIALDDYFSDPTMDCLERLYDTINAMDLSLMPQLSRCEKLIMRVSERKDVFMEKFVSSKSAIPSRSKTRSSPSLHDSGSDEGFTGRTRTVSSASTASSVSQTAVTSLSSVRHPEIRTQVSPEKVHNARKRLNYKFTVRTEGTSSEESQSRFTPSPKDTHFYETSITYKSLSLPIRIPLHTFEEEVGEYSIIQLIQTFSASGASVQGPLHPHLHTNGSLTHPIILIFNAIVTGKKVLFLGHGKPAGLVSNYVLAACALGSGCGSLLRGITARMFPYANLSSKEVVESVSGFIAGVTNPIFEQALSWDVLCNIDSGKICVCKDILPPQSSPNLPQPPPVFSRNGALKAEASLTSEEEMGRVPGQNNYVNGQARADFAAKSDNADNVFMEEIISAISLHYGENVIRARFTDYASRFIRLASRYEEELTGSTTIGYPSRPYADGLHGDFGQLGSGLSFWDESVAMRELQLNASRIEGWRTTESYRLYQKDFITQLERSGIQGFDLSHQVWRLRHSKFMSDRETELIMRTLAEHVQTYEQVVEFLSFFPPHAGGLLPFALGLFHQRDPIRDIIVEILDVLRAYPVGYQFLQSLNPFQRFAYVRLAFAREERFGKGLNKLYPPPWTVSRTPSNRSESSLGTG